MNKKLNTIILLLMLVLGTITRVQATNLYWIGGTPGSTTTWSVATNWSTTSDGLTPAGAAPNNANADNVFFTNISSVNCILNPGNTIVAKFTMDGYGGTFDQNNKPLTIGTGGFVMTSGTYVGGSFNVGAAGFNMSGGTFTGGPGMISVGGPFTLTGGTFTSTSSRLSITGNYSHSGGTFNHNNGEIFFTGIFTITITASGTSFYDCRFYPLSGTGGIFTIHSSTVMTVEHLLTSSSCTINGTGTVNVHGDITQTGTSQVTAGTATITINGTGDQILYGQTDSTTVTRSPFCSIKINKTSGTLYLKDYISVAGSWQYIKGTSDSLNVSAYSSVVCFSGINKTISGTHKLKNVWFYGLSGQSFTATVNTGDTLSVTGTLKFVGTSGTTAINGGIKALGDINTALSGAGMYYTGTGSVTICGTGTQTITGRSTIDQGNLKNVIIKKNPSDTLRLNGLISVLGDWKYLSGIIKSTGSTIAFTYTATITGSHTLNNVTFHNYTTTISSGTTLTVGGTLTFGGTGATKINTGTVNAQGNITVSNTSATSGGTGLIKINGGGNQTLTGSGAVGLGNLCNVTIDKTDGTLTLASIINTAGTFKYTQGTVNAGTSTLVAPTIDCAGLNLYNVSTNGSGTVTVLSSNLSALGKITIRSGAVLNGNSKSIFVGGDWDNTGTFTYSNTDVNFTGSGVQYITKPSSTVNFHQLKVNKPSGKLVLSAPVTVNNALTLTKGKVITTATNILALVDNATTTTGSDSAYVSGPMKKTGNDAFTFPLGDTLLSTGAFHPLKITAPSSTSDAFTGQYYSTTQTAGATLQTDSLASISTCEHWILTRNNGSSTVIPSVDWNSNSCNVDCHTNRLAAWNGTQWRSLGYAGITVNGNKGTLNATSGYSASSLPLTIARPINWQLVVSSGTDKNINATASTSIGAAPTATGGTAPYTYVWTPSTGLSSSSVANPTASPNTTTNYILTVTDYVGCVKKDTVIVNINGPLIVNAGNSQTVCAGTPMRLGGTPSVMGGVAPYTYSWSPAAGLSNSSVSNPSVSPTATTTYTLSVTDSVGTTVSNTVTMTVLALPIVNAGSNQTVCKGTSVSLGGSPTASSGAAPYIYLWSSTADSVNYDSIANPTSVPYQTGIYTVIVVDANNCQASDDVTITVKSDIAPFAGSDVTILKRDTVVIGGNPTANYGTAPFTYSWSPSTGLTSSTVANPKASPAATTSYVVTITDAAACGSFKDTVIVTVDSMPYVDAGADINLCLHDTITLGGNPTVRGGELPYTYSWSPSTGLTSSTVANPKASPGSTTTYILTVTDDDAYVQKDTVIVTVHAIPTAYAGNDSTIYRGTMVLADSIVADGGTAPYTYYWSSNDENLLINNSSNPLVTLTDTTTFYLAVADSNNCYGYDTVTINFNDVFGSLCNLDSCTWTIDGIDSTNYTVGSGQKLSIRTSGIARGVITLNSGGSICNSGVFEPASFNFNGGVFSNNSTGVMMLDSTLALTNSGTELLNDGEININGNFKTLSGTNLLNTGDIELQGDVFAQTVDFVNEGVITLNAGNFNISNAALVVNEGTFRGIDSLKNSDTLRMGDLGMVFTTNLFNYSSGVIEKIIHDTSSSFGGIVVCSITNNAGDINDSVDICDKTPSAGPVYLDTNTGTVESSVTYCHTSGVIADSSEVCGTCPTLVIENTGCAGDLIVFTAVSKKTFDRYQFYKNDTLVQNTASNTYTLLTPADSGDTYSVTGISFYTPCKKIIGDTITITKNPIVSIAGDTIAVADSVILVASGALNYVWFNMDGDTLSTDDSVIVYPTVTSTYVVYGTNSIGCTGMATYEVEKPMQVTYSTTNPTYFLPYSGAIDLAISGGKFPFEFLWNTGHTSANLSGLEIGDYSVIVTDADGYADTVDITLGYAMAFVATGATTSATTITRTAAGDGWGEAGSFSHNNIASQQDGWAEFIVGNTDESYMFGLASENNNNNYTTIDHAINMEEGDLKIYEDGSLVSSVGTCVEGDVIRIERVASSILYKKNGATLYTSSTDASLSLSVATALNSAGAQIKGVQSGLMEYSSDYYRQVNGSIAACNGDVNKNFVHSVVYDENENIISEGKSYFDYLGRTTQTQTRLISENDVIASQTIYDVYGRPVLTTLPAPINQSDLCYKEKFITNGAGADYSTADFNLPNYSKYTNTFSAGEVNNPKPVGASLPNTLGWYYSNNNNVEPFVPASSYPYTRVEYDDNNLGAVKRSAAAGEQLRMGSGHESESYTMYSFNEADYLYGKNKTWIVENYQDANYDGQGTITPAAVVTNNIMIKTISIDQNGQESVTFTDGDGKLLASCLSGLVNGGNANVMQITRQVNGKFVDIHLPKGCESSLVLGQTASIIIYNIFNLKTGQYVKINNNIDFRGTTPNLPAGIYRILFKGTDATAGRDGETTSGIFTITQNVNYYNFSINYYDKAGRAKLSVPPAGADEDYIPSTGTVPNHKMIASVQYNSQGLTEVSITPDAGATLYSYSKDGKLRFSQDAKQRASNAEYYLRKFSYINYDDIGRVVETGEYDPTASGSSNPYYFDKLLPGTYELQENTIAASTILESNSSSTNNLDVGRCTQQSYIAYDVADEPILGYEQHYTLGKVTKAWNEHNTTYYSYDELGRLTWTVQQISNMPVTSYTTTKIIDYTYDFNGNLTEVAYQKNSTDEDFYHYYEYDADKRLKKVYTSTDAGVTKQEQANYTYYKHGPLKRVELANKLQGVDYVYTINGWLKSINSPDMNERDPGKDGVAGNPLNPLAGGRVGVGPDLFGMTLDYYTGDYIRRGTYVQTFSPTEANTQDAENTSGDIEMDTYDAENPPPTPSMVTRNLFNGILKAQRWQTIVPDVESNIQYMGDQLMSSYAYDNKYQLASSTFGSVTTAGSLNAGVVTDEEPPAILSSNDYRVSDISYDRNGNIRTLRRNGFGDHAGGLAMDQLTYNYNTSGGRLLNNKLRNVSDAISSTAYSSFGFKAGQSTDNYTYDAIGQQVSDNTTGAGNYNEYDVYGKVTAVYADAAKTTLRARFTYDEKGYRIKKSDGTTDTWYIRDASGNVISIYENPTEDENIVQKEMGVFGSSRLGIYNIEAGTYLYELMDQLGNVRATFAADTKTEIHTAFDASGTYDYLYTYNTNIDKTTTDHSFDGANASVKLTAGQFGTGIFNIAAKAGQTLTGSIWYKTSGTTTPDAMLVFALNSKTTNQLIDWDATAASGNTNWTELTFSYTLSADGILNIYPWNNGSQTVWFDDLILTFGNGGGIAKAEVISFTDYYAHGSVMPGRNYVGSDVYRYGYQGQFAEQDPETGKNTFELRQWDGLLGRWSSTDPYGQHHSPYLGMSNNPLNFVDFDGGIDGPNDWVGCIGENGKITWTWNPNISSAGQAFNAGFDAYAAPGSIVYAHIDGSSLPSGNYYLGENGTVAYLGAPSITVYSDVGGCVTCPTKIESAPEPGLSGNDNLSGYGSEPVSTDRYVPRAVNAEFRADNDSPAMHEWKLNNANYLEYGGKGVGVIEKTQYLVQQTLEAIDRLPATVTLPLWAIGVGELNAAKGGTQVIEQAAVHGNSLKSLKPTWGYKLYSNDGTFLKNGITSKLKPESRYTRSFMKDKFMESELFPNRKAAWDWEFQQNQILRGPLNKNMH